MKLITQKQAVAYTLDEIKSNMYSKHTGLVTRWGILNQAFSGGIKFGLIYTIGGPSGSGKSFVMNMIRWDMVNLNKDCQYKYKIINFVFEMPITAELVRSCSYVYKKSFKDLMSSNEKLDSKFYQNIVDTQDLLIDDINYYCEESSTLEDVNRVIEGMHDKFPDHKFIITMDHSLLLELDRQNGITDDLSMVSATYKYAIHWKKKFKDTVIILSQCNSSVESAERRSADNPHLHYLTKSDLYSNKSSFHDSDYVLLFNKPSSYNLETYGPNRYPTKDLIACHLIKDRLYGNSGMIRFRQDFANGNLIYPYDQNTTNNS